MWLLVSYLPKKWLSVCQISSLRQAGYLSLHDDPVLLRRKRLARLAKLGQRSGYFAFFIALIVFIIGFATSFTNAVAITLIVLLILGSFLLAPSIVLHHAVKAAADIDRQ